MWCGVCGTPVLLLGYDYPLHSPPAGVLLMIGLWVVLGSLLGWLRIRSGSGRRRSATVS